MKLVFWLKDLRSMFLDYAAAYAFILWSGIVPTWDLVQLCVALFFILFILGALIETAIGRRHEK